MRKRKRGAKISTKKLDHEYRPGRPCITREYVEKKLRKMDEQKKLLLAEINDGGQTDLQGLSLQNKKDKNNQKMAKP